MKQVIFFTLLLFLSVFSRTRSGTGSDCLSCRGSER